MTATKSKWDDDRAALSATKTTLEKDYYTSEEATEIVRKANPGMEYSHRQMSRALDRHVIAYEVIGRVRYIPGSELSAYLSALQPTSTDPTKLRHRRYWRSSNVPALKPKSRKRSSKHKAATE